MKLLKGVVLAGVLVALSACSSDKVSDWGAAEAEQETHEGGARQARPVTEAEALEVIVGYNEANRQAYEDLDATALEEVAAGSLLQRATAEITRAVEISGGDQGMAENREYTDPKLIIPGEGWWMADVAAGDDRRLLTFAQGDDGQWLLVSAVSLNTELPPIATDENGFAATAPDDDRSSRFLPRDAAPAYQDLWETGGEQSGSTLAATQGGADILEQRTPDDPMLLARYTPITPEHTDLWVLRTQDGGTLTIGHVAHTETVTALRLPGGAAAEYNPEPRNPLQTRHTGEFAMWMPAGDFPEILGDEWTKLGAL
ncbi:hypothetical protein [Streptomyces xiamenensis]|uniref:hypothetical protein n=1 Tax=Streptomyces xiamenensis TaxID=408015 RepID=UPI0035E210AA